MSTKIMGAVPKMNSRVFLQILLAKLMSLLLGFTSKRRNHCLQLPRSRGSFSALREGAGGGRGEASQRCEEVHHLPLRRLRVHHARAEGGGEGRAGRRLLRPALPRRRLRPHRHRRLLRRGDAAPAGPARARPQALHEGAADPSRRVAPRRRHLVLHHVLLR